MTATFFLYFDVPLYWGFFWNMHTISTNLFFDHACLQVYHRGLLFCIRHSILGKPIKCETSSYCIFHFITTLLTAVIQSIWPMSLGSNLSEFILGHYCQQCGTCLQVILQSASWPEYCMLWCIKSFHIEITNSIIPRSKKAGLLNPISVRCIIYDMHYYRQLHVDVKQFLSGLI